MKLIILILASIILYFNDGIMGQREEKRYEQCLNKMSNAYNFVPEIFDSVEIKRTSTAARIIKTKQSVKIQRVMLRRYTSHCKAALATGEYENCAGTTTKIDLSHDDIYWSAGHKKCMIGDTCPISGPCWGSSSDACTSSSRNIYSGVKLFTFQDKIQINRFHSNCIQDWECIVEDLDLNIWAEIREEGFTFSSKWTNGKEIIFNEEKHIVEITQGEYLVIPPISKSYDVGEVSCLSDLGRVVCRFTKGMNDIAVGSSFLVNKKGMGTIGYMLIEVDLKGIDEGVINRGRSASVDSLWETTNELLYSQSQSHFNDMLLQHEINEIKKWVHKIVHASSIQDDEYLAKLLGGSFKTKWMNNHVVAVYPCMHEPENNPSLCPIGMPREMCETTTLNATNITMFTNVPLDLEILALPKILDADSEKINKELEQLKEELEKQKIIINTNNNSYADRFNLWSFVSQWFNFVGSFCGVLALILQLLGCRRS